MADPVAEYVVRAPAMMLVGMGLYRAGVINAGRDAAWYRMAMRRSFAVGLPLCSVAWVFVEEQEDLALLLNNLGVPFMALGYVCLVMWACAEGWLPRLQARPLARLRTACRLFSMACPRAHSSRSKAMPACSRSRSPGRVASLGLRLSWQETSCRHLSRQTLSAARGRCTAS